MAESSSRAFLTAEDVVGLLHSDSEDDYLDDDGLDDVMFPGSDDELGFEEVVVRGDRSESEEENEAEREEENESEREEENEIEM